MICAYCQQDAVATREHVIPAFIYRFQKELEASVIGWNEVAQKMIGGEHQVRDVCQKCNGGALSELDAYGKQFLIASGFLNQNYTRLSADFTYDYDKLARWLLKISFNSSRTDRGHSHLFECFIPYILTGKPTPAKMDLAIIASLAAPVAISQLSGDYKGLQDLADNKGRVNPFFTRISYAPDLYKTFTLRIVMFGPLIFFMLMYLPGISAGIMANETKRFIKATPNSLLLQRDRTRALMEAGPTTWLEYYAPQVRRQQQLGAV